jgi:hypothetical protein
MGHVTAIGVVTALVSGCLLAPVSAAPQVESQHSPQIDPTELEAFAAMPTSMVIWASPVGRLDAPESRAIVTAVALEDRETQIVMRGLRIDLIHVQPQPDCNLRWLLPSVLCARENAAIWLEGDILGRVRDGIERGNAESNLIISFRRGRPEPTTGLIIGGYQFDGLQPVDLLNLVDSGIAELRRAPR